MTDEMTDEMTNDDMSHLGDPIDEDEFVIEGLDEVRTSFHFPAGDYLARVTDIEDTTSKSSGAPMKVFTVEFEEGEPSGISMKYYASMQRHALFALKRMLVACNVDCNDRETRIRRSDIIGTQIIVTLKDDVWDGNPISRIANVKPA